MSLELAGVAKTVPGRPGRAPVQGDLVPKLNEPQDAQVWLDAPGAPVAKLDDEDPQPVTIRSDGLLRSWQN